MAIVRLFPGGHTSTLEPPPNIVQDLDMLTPVSSVPSSAPIAWSKEGIELACSRLNAMLKRLPLPLRTKVQAGMDDARQVVYSNADGANNPGWIWLCYEASRYLERLSYEATGCPNPGEEWARPGKLASIRLMEPIRIRFSLQHQLVDRLFGRWDAFGTRTEKSCNWMWERCNGGVRTDDRPIVPGVVPPGSNYGLEYELIYNEGVIGSGDER